MVCLIKYGYLVSSLIFSTVTFDSSSQGELAMVIYEWKDVRYLGKETSPGTDDDLPVSTLHSMQQALRFSNC